MDKFKISDEAYVHKYTPTFMSKDLQKGQQDAFLSQMRLFELDMNLMSPISWAFHMQNINSMKLYIKFLKIFSQNTEKEVLRDHAPIFYGFIKQIISLGVIDLEDFLNPDGVGEDRGCELFQQTMSQNFLPQYDNSDQNYTAEYVRSLNALERNLAQAFQIDKIETPHNQELTKHGDRTSIYEVQYGFIHLDWLNVLNVFNQEPPHS